MRAIFVALLTALFATYAVAECPNACSAHGKCGAFDMCQCYRNWMSSDCSERVCPFGLAHVDTPKGDLDASGNALTNPNTVVVANSDIYGAWGTTEQYPNMKDSNGVEILNSAHGYMECSNKGQCDRSSGTCTCFPGYGGSACQRAECPTSSAGVCSGHGVCESIRRISELDYNNIYRLWDQDSTMGCVCDAGYFGPDCSQRQCKWGADPLYYDDFANVRYANFTYQIYTVPDTAAGYLSDGSAISTSNYPTVSGNYSITFYDAYGEDWQTAPIDVDAKCSDILNAFYAIPNNVVPKGSMRCLKHNVNNPTINAADVGTTVTFTAGQKMDSTAGTAGYFPIYDSRLLIQSKYTLVFAGNAGLLKQIKVNKFLDGTRASMYTNEKVSTLGVHIYANGFAGENTDLVPDLCEGVLGTLTKVSGSSGYYYELGFAGDAAKIKAFKKCLGDSNGDVTDNTEVYNWDYGSYKYPHLIKLVEATQDMDDTSKLDHAKQNHPLGVICSDEINQLRIDTAANALMYANGWCTNNDPPGFYAVLIYDNANGVAKFKIINRAGQDYATTTNFHIYTTTGYLKRISETNIAVTTDVAGSDLEETAFEHSNTVYITNTGTPNAGAAISCEVGNPGTNNDDCVNKGDYVMLLNVGAVAGTAANEHTMGYYKSNTEYTSANFLSNPIYPNIYTVMKISQEDKTSTAVPVSAEVRRQQMVLNYGLNTKYEYNSGGTSQYGSVYKFYPPTSTFGEYAGPCSLRGLCDTATGLCRCFPGYTSDNCGEQNSLAK